MAEKELPIHATTALVEGRTFIVTGANTGIGYETTKHLLNLGAARVIMAVRNLDAGAKAKAKIAAELGKKDVPADIWHLDLASFASVRAFASKATAELDRIDGLVENAGVFAGSRDEAKPEGWNVSTTVNVLSTFLLAGLMLPKLSETAKKLGFVGADVGSKDTRLAPHLTIVGSNWPLHQFHESWANIKDDPLVGLEDESKCPIGEVYALSKLLDIQSTRELGTTIAPFSRTGVVINTVCPGLCMSDLARYQTQQFQTHIFGVIDQIGRTSEQGSRNLLYAVTADAQTSGHFLENAADAEAAIPEFVKESQKNSWDVVAKELEKIEPGFLTKLVSV
ncbi:uncharacterized protein B0I36DRAFT_389219 [Microdochium trichocladiopsis]|uniref:Uncharacterized protein n=1 Tax=Microdochium trichocladiopsis TaxID=1682393 RepID=A0A9P9BIC6_9PEZI|nr:uncharacterized protein B0I36DRAFT_389219 [Microdochium trichocladiopsis]KAH7014268.1 hypothetical protein B0I36DRAFT_389219 [Microdochium trichocladiopsis]